MPYTKTKTLITAIAAVLFCAIGALAQVRVQAPARVNANDKFRVTVTINDANASIPEAASIPRCRFLGSGVLTRITSQMINGRTESRSVMDVTFTYLAGDEGSVTIPAYKVRLSDGKTVSTKPQQLTIVAADHPLSANDRTRPDVRDVDDGTVLSPEAHFSANDMFVRIILDKNTVYEQEPVVATIKLYSNLNMGAKFQLLTQPTFEGFLSEDLQVTSPQSTETVDGKSYNTFVVKRMVLYPQKSGELKVTSGTYEITLETMSSVNTGLLIPDHRIMRKTVQTPDKSAILKVLPLPEPRPASFDGAVGSFDAMVSLSQNTPRTNEPLTYTIKIEGKGNIKYLKTPKLNLPAGLDQYTPKTDIDARYIGGDIGGTYTATYTIVPQEVGSFGIPPLHFTYFNPQTREYRTIDLRGYDLKVEKGSDSGETATKSKKMTDIHHIHIASQPLTGQLHYTYLSWWYWMLYVLLTLALVSSVFIYRRRIRLNADVQGRRLARAMRVAMKRFKTARRQMEAHNSEAFYTEINKALTGYLSDKLAIPASQLVRENISSQLAAYGLSDDEAANVINILDDCEMARFTPMGSDTEMSTLYDKVLRAVKSIENVKQTKKTTQQ